jgi:hypothetical protein
MYLMMARYFVVVLIINGQQLCLQLISRDSPGSVQGLVAGCCECGNEPSVSIKYVEFPSQLSNH